MFTVGRGNHEVRHRNSKISDLCGEDDINVQRTVISGWHTTTPTFRPELGRKLQITRGNDPKTIRLRSGMFLK